MRVTVNNAIAELDGAEWNSLSNRGNPFLRHEFLAAAESSGSVSAESGWIPRHLTLHCDGGLRAAMPLYEKRHSWGEFVFDWSWARAFEQAGLNYYPKLVSALPFTPATGPRLLLRNEADDEATAALLAAAIALTADSGCSSLHVLFPDRAELPAMEQAGLRLRKDCQFHWHNRGYTDFDGFLTTFSSAKRKKARRERRRVREAGISFQRLRGGEIDAERWCDIYRLISNTFLQRGSLPYLNLAFFQQVGKVMPDDILVILAELEGHDIAAAVFFEGEDVLYGRYWGSDGHFDSLHFETCYYQGIDYCIETGKSVFEPGTQGEHKISRGFVPEATWSAHWLRQPEFLTAIGRYLDEERRHVDRYMEAADEHSPYRNE